MIATSKLPGHRPPIGASPAEILETWLPAAFAAAPCRWEGSSPALRLTLAGVGGGEWELEVDGGLRVRRTMATVGFRRPDPDIWIRMPAADFLAVLFGSEDLIELLPADVDLVDLLFARAPDLELLEKLDGRIKFEIEGRRRRRWSVDAAFGRAGMQAGRPRTTVRLDSGTYDRLAARAESPLQALLAGRLRVDGDRVLAMQVLMLVASRLGG